MATKLFGAFLLFLILPWFGAQIEVNNVDQFGKNYNEVRRAYGSPIIHEYMELKMESGSFLFWTASLSLQDTITKGYHAEKGCHIHPDSVLQEDDIFRKRISDSTFAFIGILTMGNQHDHRFRSIYYDTVCAADIQLPAYGRPCHTSFKPNTAEITIEKADSILQSWGTSRLE